MAGQTRNFRRFLLALLAGLAGACAPSDARQEVARAAEPDPPPPPALVEADWPDLPGWSRDGALALLPALLSQCTPARGAPEPTDLVPAPLLGDAAWWQGLCSDAARLRPRTQAAARAFVAARFRPALLDATGLLTGYFEPVYAACTVAGPGCETPVRARPPGLVDVDARRIDAQSPPRRIRGCIDRGALSPCPPRAAIEAGAMPDAPVLAWMDPVEKFFMQIQGSGRLSLPGGATLRLGYEAQNGAPYVPIGRVLLDRGELTRPVSMQSIRAWLDANPARAEEVLNTNPSYVFFRPLDLPPGAGPLGAMGVPLTAGRSAAVDTKLVPLGLPLYLAPQPEPGSRIPLPPPAAVLAQDTGGAIRGPARVDLFVGTGNDAGERAGRLVAPLKLWLLLPRLGGAPAP